MRSRFIQTLVELAERDRNIILLTADLGFKVFDEFRARCPEQFINVGVAEANMVGVAAGLAFAGKKVYCYSMASFLTMRAFEQIRIDICSHNLPVTLVGIGGALGYALEGVTHHALEDVAIMRALPNMSVVIPGDVLETESAVRKSAYFPSPLYLRLAKDSSERIHQVAPSGALGESIELIPGNEGIVLSCGPVLGLSFKVVQALRKSKHDIGLISMPAVKPLDLVTLRRISANVGAIFTIEEHSIVGGFGSAVSEVLLEWGFSGVFRRIGLPDSFFKIIGERSYLSESVGLDPEAVSEVILQCLELVERSGTQRRKAMGSNE